MQIFVTPESETLTDYYLKNTDIITSPRNNTITKYMMKAPSSLPQTNEIFLAI